jgi:hypothetical protein
MRLARRSLNFLIVRPSFTHSRQYSATSVNVLHQSFNKTEVKDFLERSNQLSKPLLLKSSSDISASTWFPASERWFLSGDGRQPILRPSYLNQFSSVPVPYELIYPQEVFTEFLKWLSLNRGLPVGDLANIKPPIGETERRFWSFTAPLGLMVLAAEFNRDRKTPLKELYIAQAQLSDIPPKLRDDLRTPYLVEQAGKGDIYGSSLWLGLEPTYTPLHRDPNPNLFCQLCSTKTVRLLPPRQGQSVYESVQKRLGRWGNSRFRENEMMEGSERIMLHEEVWESFDRDTYGEILEAHLEPGDALFIPLGWWHSVKSKFSDGRLNGSVNWWFR